MTFGSPGEPAQHSMPDFSGTVVDGPVRSFCVAFWGGLQEGSVKVDSANRPNGLVRVSRLDLRALEIALSILLTRHPVLNCRVEDRAGEPWLVSLPTPARPLVTVLDHRSGRGRLDRDRAEAAIGALVWRPFDMATGPLYRAYIVGFGHHEAYVGLVAHHFIADGVSIGILMRELGYIFQTLVHGGQLRLPPPGPSYGAYLKAMTSWIESAAGSAMLKREIDRLRAIPTVDLCGRVDPNGSFEETFVIEAEVASKVRSLARRLGVPPFSVLLAAQNVLLLPYCSGATVPVKVIITGREFSALANMVGNMADRIVVLSELTGCLSFSDVVRQTQAGLSWARRHALVRHELIRAAPAAAGLSMAAPVFNFTTAKPTGPMRADALDLDSRPLRVPAFQVERTRPNDLYYLVMTDTGDEMRANIRYGKGRITGFVDQFRQILTEASEDPDAALNRRPWPWATAGFGQSGPRGCA